VDPGAARSKPVVPQAPEGYSACPTAGRRPSAADNIGRDTRVGIAAADLAVEMLSAYFNLTEQGQQLRTTLLT
jgi:hypothetical protein